MSARTGPRLAVSVSLFGFAAWAQPAAISLQVRGPVAPVSANGKAILTYEVELSNTSAEEVSLISFQGGAAGEAQPLFTYNESGLAHNLRQITPPAPKDPRALKPGAHTVVFCWLELASNSVPHAIDHQLVSAPASRRDRTQTLRASTPVEPDPSLSLGAPLGQGDWWAAVGPSNTSDHRRAQVRVDGNPGAPYAQRFAIDWIELCDGRVSTRKGSSNAEFCGYGKDVLAVADSQVVAVKDGVPDNKPGEDSRAVKIKLETLLGNCVVLDLGNHLYALYVHLQPGSIAVKPGEKVLRGQTIGRLGNSGNSDAPHLHFHVARADSVDQVTSVQSQPFPFAFDHFDLLGQYAGRDVFSLSAAQPREQELVVDGAVVRF